MAASKFRSSHARFVRAKKYQRKMKSKQMEKKKQTRRNLLGMCCCWRSAGLGRWHKRRLSKSRRRYAKSLISSELNGTRPGKSPNCIESEVNWKGW